MGGPTGHPGPKDSWCPADSAAPSRLHLEASLPVFRAKADTAGGRAHSKVSSWNPQAEVFTPCTYMETEAQVGVSAHTSPKMDHLCLAAKPFPIAFDTSPSALPIQKRALLEVMRAQLSGPGEQASGSQRDGGELGREEGAGGCSSDLGTSCLGWGLQLNYRMGPPTWDLEG